MSFAAPAVLLALALLPVALVAYVVLERRRGRARAALVGPALRAAVTPRRAGWRRHVAPAAGLVAAGLLLAALARPQASVAVPVEQATVVIATDRSGSMLAQDVRPSRLVAARGAAATFIDELPDELRLGAIAFNHEPTVLESPTVDHEAVRRAIAAVQVAGSTATGDALAAALELLRSSSTAAQRRAPAAIVLLSDGKSVRGRDVLEVAREAARQRVPVYTVALGTAGGTITGKDGQPQQVPPDPATMREVARITGGKSFAIEDAEALAEVYEQLGSQLATEQRKEDVGGAFGGVALLVLTGGSLLSLRLTGRPLG
jgi:Ca-activated chloride channel homolog